MGIVRISSILVLILVLLISINNYRYSYQYSNVPLIFMYIFQSDHGILLTAVHLEEDKVI